MGTRRKYEINQQYHLYARGVDKRDIFLSEHDYLRFMALLHICNDIKPGRLSTITRKNYNSITSSKTKPFVQIDQYCLMPNHFHILCTETTVNGISRLMQKVLSGYTVYFNKKYRREGALVSSTYKSKHINNDLYALYIKKYIFYNPLKLIDPEYNSKNILLHNEGISQENFNFLKEYLYKIP